MKFTQKYKIFIIFVALIVSVFFMISQAQALTNELGTFSAPKGSATGDIGSMVGTVMDALITVGQVAFIILFLIGGVMYLTSMGNEEQAGKARKLMLQAIIGLVIVMSAWAISTWILNRLKGSTSLNNSPQISITKIS